MLKESVATFIDAEKMATSVKDNYGQKSRAFRKTSQKKWKEILMRKMW